MELKLSSRFTTAEVKDGDFWLGGEDGCDSFMCVESGIFRAGPDGKYEIKKGVLIPIVEFEKGEMVLCRDSDGQFWEVRFYVEIVSPEAQYKFRCSDEKFVEDVDYMSEYKQCIKFDIDKVGTTDE